MNNAGGKISAADKIKQLTFNVREEAKDVHMIPVIQNNQLSTNQLSKAKYITVFDEEEVNIYDATNTKNQNNKRICLKSMAYP